MLYFKDDTEHGCTPLIQQMHTRLYTVQVLLMILQFTDSLLVEPFCSVEFSLPALSSPLHPGCG